MKQKITVFGWSFFRRQVLRIFFCWIAQGAVLALANPFWDKPIPAAEVLSHFSGYDHFTSANHVVLEIGPSDEPLCSDCFYLDLNHEMPGGLGRQRFIIGDGRQAPFADASVDAIILKNTPWYFQSSVEFYGHEEIANQLRGWVKPGSSEKDLPSLMDEWVRESEDLRNAIFSEIQRVLKPGGVFLVLRSVPDGISENSSAYLARFIDLGKQLGFRAVETPLADVQTSPRLQKISRRDRGPLWVGGLSFSRELDCEKRMRSF